MSLFIPVKPPKIISLPERLEGLKTLAFNLYWTWTPSVQKLFQRIHPEQWEQENNPIALLLQQTTFKHVLNDEKYLQSLDEEVEKMEAYLASEDTWFQRQEFPEAEKQLWAYFCTEFGIHESFPIYSGGLGVLAGDHCKTISDMNLPMVGVGLFYSHGFYRQKIDSEGQQQHNYPKLETSKLPLLRVVHPKSLLPLNIPVEFSEGVVQCAVWKVNVGRMPLLLLNTDIPENYPEYRRITDLLYVGGREMRLLQELVLGVGGVRTLRALNLSPQTWHLNEGHSAFLLLERIREFLREGKSWEEAVQRVKAKSIFTIHTPVPAGNERFEVDLVKKCAMPLFLQENFQSDTFFQLAVGADNDSHFFDLTALSLRMSRTHNGVSKLHGETATTTWESITHDKVLGLTNGVHMESWLGRPLRNEIVQSLLKKEDISQESLSQHEWLRPHLVDRMMHLDDKKLWKAHLQQKEDLAEEITLRLNKQISLNGGAPSIMKKMLGSFNPHALTIGFARRFASYKRAHLIFSDMERLRRMILDSERPLQLIFAGKAHPSDKTGQGILQKVFQMSKEDGLEGKVLFIEDYDMRLGRALTQGVDVWLNNPRRPLEASGTSGMKAAANGVPNLSILDGWWDEGYDVDNGWKIGERTSTNNVEEQDHIDVQDLYHVLESQVIPLYYNRNSEGLPLPWLQMMKKSIQKSLWDFSSIRMLEEYVEQMYFPSSS